MTQCGLIAKHLGDTEAASDLIGADLHRELPHGGGGLRFTSGPPSLVHHSDRGVQYLSIRYTERLDKVGVVTSVGSRGDSYDNALAESVNGLYRTELVRRQGPWRGLEDLGFATLKWVDWYNHRRLFRALGYVPPAEYEASNNREQVLAEAGTQ